MNAVFAPIAPPAHHADTRAPATHAVAALLPARAVACEAGMDDTAEYAAMAQVFAPRPTSQPRSIVSDKNIADAFSDILRDLEKRPMSADVFADQVNARAEELALREVGTMRLKPTPNGKWMGIALDLIDAMSGLLKSLADQDDEGLVEHAPQMIRAREVLAKATARQQRVAA